MWRWKTCQTIYSLWPSSSFTLRYYFQLHPQVAFLFYNLKKCICYISILRVKIAHWIIYEPESSFTASYSVKINPALCHSSVLILQISVNYMEALCIWEVAFVILLPLGWSSCRLHLRTGFSTECVSGIFPNHVLSRLQCGLACCSPCDFPLVSKYPPPGPW